MAPLFTLPPSCILRSPTGGKPWYLCQGKTCRYTISHPALGVTSEACSRAVSKFSGAVAGDSSLQDRGVAHYLLSLLFSLVSLSFSFYFCVPNQKYQKYLLLC